MKNSHIEWCDHTFNPWIGCTKVSPGCLHCYAEARDLRFAGGKHWGAGAPRQRTSDANWQQPVEWNWRAEMVNRVASEEGDTTPPLRPRVFCASLADWLDHEVPAAWSADQLHLISQTPNLDWLLLTKRPENFANRIFAALNYCGNELGQDYEKLSVWLHNWLTGQVPANVWIGTTAEDQPRADQRVPLLLSIPAKVHFLSCEPLLGPIILNPEWVELELRSFGNGASFFPRVDWVIAGGESGPHARPMHPAWARSLRDQCLASDVPFLFKQWGEWMPVAMPRLHYKGERILMDVAGRVTVSDWAGISGSCGETWGFEKHGKKAAGRLLDGVTHDAFPIA